ATRAAAEDHGAEERPGPPGEPAARRDAERNPARRPRPDRQLASRGTVDRYAAEDAGRRVRSHPQAIPATFRAQVELSRFFFAAFAGSAFHVVATSVDP